MPSLSEVVKASVGSAGHVDCHDSSARCRQTRRRPWKRWQLVVVAEHEIGGGHLIITAVGVPSLCVRQQSLHDALLLQRQHASRACLHVAAEILPKAIMVVVVGRGVCHMMPIVPRLPPPWCIGRRHAPASDTAHISILVLVADSELPGWSPWGLRLHAGEVI